MQLVKHPTRNRFFLYVFSLCVLFILTFQSAICQKMNSKNDVSSYIFPGLVTFDKDSILPIQLAEFSGSFVSVNIVQLHWTTVSEINSYGFFVERKLGLNGTFETVSDLIPGAGTSLELHEYSWIDSAVNVGTYYYRLQQIDLDANISYSDEIMLIITSRMYNVSDKWNLISVPLTVSDLSKTVLFPTATSSAFAFQSGYTVQLTLTNGVGYWLKFSGAQDVTMNGLARISDTISVQSGWNMIGSISSPIQFVSVQSLPGGIISSKLFGFNAGYFIADTIQPGKGYWVKVNQSGKLILTSSDTLILSNRRTN